MILYLTLRAKARGYFYLSTSDAKHRVSTNNTPILCAFAFLAILCHFIPLV